MIKSGYQSAFAPGVDVSSVFPDDPDRVVDDNRAMTYDSFTKASEEADNYLEAAVDLVAAGRDRACR